MMMIGLGNRSMSNDYIDLRLRLAVGQDTTQERKSCL